MSFGVRTEASSLIAPMSLSVARHTEVKEFGSSFRSSLNSHLSASVKRRYRRMVVLSSYST